MKKHSSVTLFITTILIEFVYLLLPYTNISSSIISVVGIFWNLILGALVGFLLVKKEFLNQFKHFNFRVLALGIPLIFVVGITFSTIYSFLFGKLTTNAIGENISLTLVFLQIPFMLLGEELLSTNILIALQKKGFSFLFSTIVCSFIFALWHIPAYGFHPIQLVMTLMPARLVLNYIWKRSNSVWVSWICHFIYDLIGFIPFFFK